MIAEEVIQRLAANYSTGSYKADPFKVLIFTILSQRTRDENTIAAAGKLFSKFKSAKELASADIRDIEENIKKAGFYRVKAKRIKAVAEIIVEKFNGKVPDSLEDLLKLPGVGRKTANCVLAYGFGKNALPVDTHVHRISNRLGLVNSKTIDQTEAELKRIVPVNLWSQVNELFVKFGQTICRPVNPKCEICLLSDICKRRL
ncbi:MAG: endonuclease III [Methanocellales archaeon]